MTRTNYHFFSTRVYNDPRGTGGYRAEVFGDGYKIYQSNRHNLFLPVGSAGVGNKIPREYQVYSHFLRDSIQDKDIIEKIGKDNAEEIGDLLDIYDEEPVLLLRDGLKRTMKEQKNVLLNEAKVWESRGRKITMDAINEYSDSDSTFETTHRFLIERPNDEAGEEIPDAVQKKIDMIPRKLNTGKNPEDDYSHPSFKEAIKEGRILESAPLNKVKSGNVNEIEGEIELGNRLEDQIISTLYRRV